jgi:molybdopterin-containing oxidoreductase family molybdopterin binding subunit
MPNANRIINKLFPQLELIFTCDLFMTATAKFSDYVLPAASFLESTDIVSFPSYFVQLQEKVIEPLHESKSDFWIAQELGRRMGFGDYFEKKEEESIKEVLASVYTEEEGVTLEKLKKGPVAQKTRKLPLKTPTKRIEFYVESLKQFGQELPVYLEPLESLRQDKAKKYSLSLLTPHPRYRIHSMLANVPELLKFDPEPRLEINPSDAKARNISDGSTVYVFNDRGRLKVKVKLTADIKPGVVSLDEGWWPEQYLEGHHNELTHEEINPVQQFILGPNAAYCDVLVEVSNI